MHILFYYSRPPVLIFILHEYMINLEIKFNNVDYMKVNHEQLANVNRVEGLYDNINRFDYFMSNI
jgi:hypothetical protein